jgi:hypothetical protein
MTNKNYIQLSNMHNFGIEAPFRPIHLPIPSFVICTHLTEYFSIRYWYLFENIFDTMMRSPKINWLHCLVGYVVKRLNTSCRLEHSVWVARSVGVYFDNINEYPNFIIDSLRCDLITIYIWIVYPIYARFLQPSLFMSR